MMFEYTSFTRRAPAPEPKRHTLFYTKKSVEDGHDDHIFWTDDGGIGFNVGGHVIIKTAEEWHALAKRRAAKKPRRK